MKTQTLKETATHYIVEIDQIADSEPMLLESNGKPVAVLISAAEYDAFRDWLVTRQATPTAGWVQPGGRRLRADLTPPS